MTSEGGFSEITDYCIGRRSIVPSVEDNRLASDHCSVEREDIFRNVIVHKLYASRRPLRAIFRQGQKRLTFRATAGVARSASLYIGFAYGDNDIKLDPFDMPSDTIVRQLLRQRNPKTFINGLACLRRREGLRESRDRIDRANKAY